MGNTDQVQDEIKEGGQSGLNLFILIICLLFMPFFVDACSVKEYSIGFPKQLVSYKIDQEAALNQDPQKKVQIEPQLKVDNWLKNLGINFGVLLAGSLILSLWMASPLYKSNRRLFVLGNWVIFLYVLVSFAVGWTGVIFTFFDMELPEAYAFPYQIYISGSYAFGALPFSWLINMIMPDPQPIDLFPIAFGVALVDAYLVFFLLSLGLKLGFKKIKNLKV